MLILLQTEKVTLETNNKMKQIEDLVARNNLKIFLLIVTRTVNKLNSTAFNFHSFNRSKIDRFKIVGECLTFFKNIRDFLRNLTIT